MAFGQVAFVISQASPLVLPDYKVIVYSMQWQPAPGWMLVKPLDVEDRIGSLFVPEQAIERMVGWQYEVVLTGGPLEPKANENGKIPFQGTAHEFKAGDWILCPPRQGMDYDEERLLLMPEKSVWAVIE